LHDQVSYELLHRRLEIFWTEGPFAGRDDSLSQAVRLVAGVIMVLDTAVETGVTWTSSSVRGAVALAGIGSACVF
jgi:hypothetical protein